MLHCKCVGRLEKSMTQLLPHNRLIAFAPPPPFTPREQFSLLQEDLRANQPIPTLKVKKKIPCDVLVNLFALCVL